MERARSIIRSLLRRGPAWAAIICLMGVSSCEKSGKVPLGQELSTVEGVSLIRIPSSGGTSVTQGSTAEDAHIEAEGIDLLTGLGKASDNSDPIIVLTNLPPGDFKLNARTDQGGTKELARRVCQAYSQAFPCRVSHRMIEVDALVLRCPAREALKLKEGAAEEGFFQHNTLPAGRTRTRFSTTMNNLAWFAGYTSRNRASQNDVPDRRALLKTVFVNETGIDGLFQGEVDWNPSDPSVIISSLKALGLEVTTARRVVPAIVVEED